MLIEEAEAYDLPRDEDLSLPPEWNTEEIRILANETLKKSPWAIYYFVRNSFDYEPYYGFLKGPRETLSDKSGNDFDQAALLIALFRSAGINARFMYGTIELPLDKVMSWVGANDINTCGDLLASAGIPTYFIYRGGELSAVQIEHVWVQAWIDYQPYGGVVQKEGDVWLWLDPSYKLYNTPEDIQQIDISNQVVFNPENYLSSIQTEDPLTVYLNQIYDYIDNNLPEKSLLNVTHNRSIRKEKLEILPLLPPYKIVSVKENYSELPASFYYTVNFRGAGIDYTIKTTQINGKQITLSYIPSTQADEQTVQQYGGLYHTSPYLIEVKPVLKINGEIKTTGNAMDMAWEHEFTIGFNYPDGIVDQITNELTAGNHYALGIIPWDVSADALSAQADRLLSSLEAFPVTEQTQWDELGDDELGGMLYMAIFNYFSRSLGGEKIAQSIMHIRDIKLLSAGMSFLDMKVTRLSLTQTPIAVEPQGLVVDIDRNVYLPFPVDGDTSKITNYLILTGYNNSFLEQSVIEHHFDTNAACTLKLLQMAKENNIPIWTVNSANVMQALQALQVSDKLKGIIQDAVNAGLEVTVSEGEIQFGNWKGAGYIIMNPETGEGAFMISGGYAGAQGEVPVVERATDRGMIRLTNRAVVSMGVPGVGYTEGQQLGIALRVRSSLENLGYLSIWTMVYTPELFNYYVTKPYNKIFVHMGHGILLDKDEDGQYDPGGEEKIGFLLYDFLGIKKVIYADKIAFHQYKFVCLSACYSGDDELIEAFNPEFGVGLNGTVVTPAVYDLSTEIFRIASQNRNWSMSQVLYEVRKNPFIDNSLREYGNSSIKLALWR